VHNLKKKINIVFLFLIAVYLMSFLPTNVIAYDEDDDDNHYGYLNVDILEAYYTDYDLDGYEDDIITVFQIEVKGLRFEWYGTIKVYTALYPLTQQGTTYIFKQNMCNGFIVTEVWYNGVVEEGWFDFSVYAKAYGDPCPSSGYDKVIFDPPGGDPGRPTIDIVEIDQL